MESVKIYMRHLQMVNIYGAKIIYTGASPATLKAIAGTVPQTSWIDYTNDVVDRDKIRLIWSIDIDSNGESVTGNNGNQIKRSTSGTIRITGDAYNFIKAWCIDHVAAPLNKVDVRIEISCGQFEKYEIGAQQLRWCEGEFVCEFDVTLKQTDPVLQCMQRTLIADNHLGWFQNVPKDGKKHPRFSYCNEIRPNGTLIVLWLVPGFLSPILIVLFALYVFALIVINIINVIIGVIETIISFISLGLVFTKPDWNTIPEYNINDFINAIIQYYIESAGCGREHPAPLIRDYIQNVCTKCGITVDAITAPIFFSPTWNLDFITSSGQNLKGQVNEYFNACYFNAPIKRGVRRFNSIDVFGATKNTSQFYQEGNAPYYALNDFLDEIKGVFNSEWRIKGGKLYFWRKDWFLNGSILYDFSTNASDRLKILEGVCFEWNEIKYPAFSKGLYNKDSLDVCGNEALNQMNGTGTIGTVAYGKTDLNPNYEGVQDKQVAIGGTKFRLDGASTDYIYDAMQTLVNLQIIAPWITVMMRNVDTWLNEYAHYALLLRDETALLPKILIWDGVSYLNAKCVRTMVPVNNSLVPADPTPQINIIYNADSSASNIVENWTTRHAPENRVLGNSLTGSGSTLGIYEARDYIGSLVANNAARLVNYPMYYEPGYIGTLWDRFHYIDDPRRNPGLHMNWSVKIEPCCEDMNRLKMLGDGSLILLGEKVKLQNPYYNVGIIKEIELNLDPSENVGKYIQLKGTL